MPRQPIDLEPFREDVEADWQAGETVDSIYTSLVERMVQISRRTLERALHTWGLTRHLSARVKGTVLDLSSSVDIATSRSASSFRDVVTPGLHGQKVEQGGLHGALENGARWLKLRKKEHGEQRLREHQNRRRVSEKPRRGPRKWRQEPR
jgi:hypothetical protein